MVFFWLKEKTRKVKRTDIILLLFLALSVTNVLFQSYSITIALSSLRQILLIFGCYYLGISARIKKDSEYKIIDCLIFFAILASIFSLVFYSLNENDWSSLGYTKYWINKTGYQPSYTSFYTFDFGFKLKRMVSFYADPLALAHNLGLALILLFHTSKKRYISKFIILVVFLLTFSKSSYLLLIFYFFSVLFFKTNSKTIRRIIVICAGIIGVGMLFILSGKITDTSSSGKHLFSLLYGLRNISLFGKGIGNVGYNAGISGLVDYDTAYNERFFATCTGQVGLVGTILVYTFLIIMITRCINAYFVRKDNLAKAVAICLISITVESLVSASAISMIGTGSYFILAGIVSARQSNISNLEVYGKKVGKKDE